MSGDATDSAAENQDLGFGFSLAVVSGFTEVLRQVVREKMAAVRAVSNTVGGPTPPASTGELLFVEI